ncbi:MAG TPA: S53 family peptidase [Gaiellales bacterium]|nr:S53 family peptidase [Gaiellales bacterium]
MWVAAITVISVGALLTQAATGEAASQSGRSGESPSRPVPLRPATPGAQVTVTLHFTPRHPRSLALLASHTGARPRQAKWLRTRFGPARATAAAADRYMARHGLSVSAEGILTRTYSGSIAGASRAFGTAILLYRQDGARFRAPARKPSLPPGLARRVSSIDGLSSRSIAHPLASRTAAATTLESCAGASQLQALGRGYQPAQLASPDGYDFQSLLDAGNAGQADTIALIEFSNYTRSNVAAYQACYGTSVPITDVAVNAGTTDRSGAGEVQLDEEVAATAAPGLSHIYTYIAPNDGSTSFGSMIDSIIEDQAVTHTNVVSISWGDCEYPALFPSMRSDDDEFQLAKAAGLTVVAASGDTGSDDCGPGSHTYRVDYPSSSPYVTGVGGTSLHLGMTGSSHETAWGHPDSDRGDGGGGGASILYPMPTWQAAPGVISADTHSTCGVANDQSCREVPDVSFDANPITGYIIYSGGKWRLFGGTSAGAPLLAAIIADADTYSIAHGGGRMGGSANPFFYAHAGAPLFRDITVGSNNIYGLPDLYATTAGYDMATGLGAPSGATLAQLLLADTQGVTADQTTLSGAESATVITPAAGTTLHGTLTDQTTGLPLGGRTITIVNSYSYMGEVRRADLSAVTNAAGNWSVPVTTADAPTRLVWRALYTGEAGTAPSGSGELTLFVQPSLTLAATATWTGSSYSVAHGVTFTVKGQSTPNMAGKRLTLQTRAATATAWKATTTTALVAADGTYAAGYSFPSAGRFYLRFGYTGSTSGPWRSASSPKKLFVVS